MKAVGREFRLNGEHCILHGVCRHDMWKDQGFTLTRAQQRQDMRMIKDLGCNYVRLVHYPHDRHIVELADEIGLMVSEEPGFWQVDFRTLAARQNRAWLRNPGAHHPARLELPKRGGLVAGK